MGYLFYQWIDLIWLPIGLLAVQRQHRLKVIIFLLTCMFVMRTQVELIESTGYSTGYLNVLHSDLFTRGLIVYSVVYTLYLLLAHYSSGTQHIVFMTASITIFIFAFCISMLFMAL